MRTLVEKVITTDRWAYITGYIKASEKMFLSGDEFEKLIQSQHPEDLLKNIEGTFYGRNFSNIQDLYRADEILDSIYKDVLLNTKRLSPQDLIFNYFCIKKDFIKLRKIIKDKIKEGGIEDKTTLPEADLWIMLDEIEMPSEYMVSIKIIIENYLAENDLQKIDFDCDKETMKILRLIATNSSNILISDFTKTFIDLKNVVAVWRAKLLKLKEEILGKIIYPCDNGIDWEVYKKLLESPVSDWEGILAPFNYDKIIFEVDEKSELYKFEKKADDYVMEKLARFKQVSLGIEPIFCFMYLLGIEVQNLQLIITGVLNGLPVPAIKERLRKTS